MPAIWQTACKSNIKSQDMLTKGQKQDTCTDNLQCITKEGKTHNVILTFIQLHVVLKINM